MSPIKGLSDIVRLPRLGHIHLGEKVTDREKTYCRALQNAKAIYKIEAEKPAETILAEAIQFDIENK